MKKSTQSFNHKAALMGLVAFLAAWQASDFSLDYRAILGAVVACSMGVMSPKNAKTKIK